MRMKLNFEKSIQEYNLLVKKEFNLSDDVSTS